MQNWACGKLRPFFFESFWHLTSDIWNFENGHSQFIYDRILVFLGPNWSWVLKTYGQYRPCYGIGLSQFFKEKFSLAKKPLQILLKLWWKCIFHSKANSITRSTLPIPTTFILTDILSRPNLRMSGNDVGMLDSLKSWNESWPQHSMVILPEWLIESASWPRQSKWSLPVISDLFFCTAEIWWELEALVYTRRIVVFLTMHQKKDQRRKDT